MDHRRWKKYSLLLQSWKKTLHRKKYSKILEDNTEVTHQKDILVQQKLFYQTLYESRGTIFTDEHLKSFFEDNNPYTLYF